MINFDNTIEFSKISFFFFCVEMADLTPVSKKKKIS